jgi:hypothetical protein
VATAKKPNPFAKKTDEKGARPNPFAKKSAPKKKGK